MDGLTAGSGKMDRLSEDRGGPSEERGGPSARLLGEHGGPESDNRPSAGVSGLRRRSLLLCGAAGAA